MRLVIKKAVGTRFIYFPAYSPGIFIIIFVLVAIIYNYHEILFLPPQSIHLWRQCDCLSQAMNYYQDGNPFLMPAVHNLGNDGTGRAMSDFPIIYYLTAKIWNYTDPHESVMRIINLSIFIIALFVLFKTAERILCDSFVALFIVFLLFSSPFLVYYANNFLMDVPAFSLALIGMCFFERFYTTSKRQHLYWFAFFITVAGLLKITALLGFFAILGIFIFEFLGVKIRSKSKIFSSPLVQIIPFALVLLVVLVWYFYVKQYNATYNMGLFLTQVIPIWTLPDAEIQNVLHHLSDHFRWNYFRPEILYLILLFWILSVVFASRSTRALTLLNLLLPSGVVAFGILFFASLKDHDYYMINALIIIPAIVLAFAVMLKKRLPALYRSIIFRVFLVLILIHSIDFARRRIHGRYDPDTWQNKSYVVEKQLFLRLPEYLTALGIRPDDRVISLPDPSPNITLYMMNRKGWTNYNIDMSSDNIYKKIEMGADYLIISDPKTLEIPQLQPFLHTKLGQLEHIHIFKL
jgi:hypothetical protein